MVEDLNKKWLFVCAYGQNRSRYFSELFNEAGIKAVFCREENIKDYIHWADEVVILASEVYKDGTKVWLDYLNEENKISLRFYFIKDEPSTFAEQYAKFLGVLERIE